MLAASLSLAHQSTLPMDSVHFRNLLEAVEEKLASRRCLWINLGPLGDLVVTPVTAPPKTIILIPDPDRVSRSYHSTVIDLTMNSEKAFFCLDKKKL